MILRKMFLWGILCVLPNMISAQVDSFRFSNNLYDTSSIELGSDFMADHYLGQTIAVKMYRLKKTYTYVEAGTPASPGDKTTVKKPTIYYSMKKLNTYYKKQLKKGEIERVDAQLKLSWYLDIAYSIYSQDTNLFETALKTAKKAPEIDQVFARVVMDKSR